VESWELNGSLVSAPTRHTTAARLRVLSLEAELHSQITGEVRFDAASRALYAVDGSNDRQAPLAVVVPKSIDDAIRTVAACRNFGAAMMSRGGGTSLAGQCCNTAVVIDRTKYLAHASIAADRYPRRDRGETRYYFFWHDRLQAGGTRVSLEFQLPTVASRAGWKVDQHGPFSQLRSVERPGHPAIHNQVRSG